MNDTFHPWGYHWSRVIVPPGYADPVRFPAGGPRAPGPTPAPESGEVPPDEA
ncbi:hypothetical protein GCM10017673_05470 [Streptosporangium violaceochromogenes]|nr:hypothetical protein GCM10017673_05470 [Streptosporangium violaceochromogenes]